MFWLFWISAAFLGYTFLGYPLLLFLISPVRRMVHRRAPIFPTVSLIVAVHNESSVLPQKIENCLALNYPKDKLEIFIVSDGSTDGTPEIVRSYAERGVKLIELPERRGKHYAQMIARDAAKGEILVFTDASIRMCPNALEKIVSNFADESVGCVSSEDRLFRAKRGSLGERNYVQFEVWLRRLETRTGSVLGLSGSFFAARREVCADWHADQSSDFFVALHALRQGKRAVVDPESVGYYAVTTSERGELQRKVRTIVHGLVVFFDHLEVANPLRYRVFAWKLLSHKLCRWLAPFAFLGVMVSSLFLWRSGLFYRAVVIGEALLLIAGLLPLLVGRLASVKALKPAAFFLLGNVATLIAWLKFCTGERYVQWQPTRRN
jgi:glycosyltransferase involved in cell wall biosynthesis